MRARFSTTWKGARDQLAKASCTHRELGHRASGQITGREPVRARHLRRRRGHSSASARTSRRLAGQQGARREERGRQHAREQDGRWRPSGRCGKLREPSRSSGTTEHGRLWQLILITVRLYPLVLAGPRAALATVPLPRRVPRGRAHGVAQPRRDIHLPLCSRPLERPVGGGAKGRALHDLDRGEVKLDRLRRLREDVVRRPHARQAPLRRRSRWSSTLQRRSHA